MSKRIRDICLSMCFGGSIYFFFTNALDGYTGVDYYKTNRWILLLIVCAIVIAIIQKKFPQKTTNSIPIKQTKQTSVFGMTFFVLIIILIILSIAGRIYLNYFSPFARL